MGKSPEAKGRLRLLGWSLSDSMSSRSFKIYVAEAQKQNARNAAAAFRSSEKLRYLWLEIRATNTSRFFAHWCARTARRAADAENSAPPPILTVSFPPSLLRIFSANFSPPTTAAARDFSQTGMSAGEFPM